MIQPEQDERLSGAAPLSRRHMFMGVAMALASGVAYARQPQPVVPPLPKKSFDALVPAKIGPWSFQAKSGLVLPTEDPLSDSLYSHILTRVYLAEGQMPIMLLIAYSNTQNGMLQLHRPEVCYPASGFSLSDTLVSPIKIDGKKTLAIRRFSAESDTRSEQVLYWTRIGHEMPTSWVDQRMSVIRANLKAEIPDGILVRMSAISPTYEAAQGSLENFVRSFVGGANPTLQKLLIG